MRGYIACMIISIYVELHKSSMYVSGDSLKTLCFTDSPRWNNIFRQLWSIWTRKLVGVAPSATVIKSAFTWIHEVYFYFYPQHPRPPPGNDWAYRGSGGAAYWSPPPPPSPTPPPPMIEHIGGQVAQLTGRWQVLLRIIRRTTTARAGIELLAIDTFPRNVVDDGFASSPKINVLRRRRLVCSTTPVLSRCASASTRTRGWFNTFSGFLWKSHAGWNRTILFSHHSSYLFWLSSIKGAFE